MTTGTVYLVGAGPGDPELLTVRAARLLEEVDVVLADTLVSEGVTAGIDGARLVRVGEESGDGNPTTQDGLIERLVGEARAGNDVAHVQAGDPTVFGRGGEEIEHLADHEVPFEVVPGVPAAIGLPARAGVPLTHRDHASSLTVVARHGDPAGNDLDWDALARTVVAGGTLVILTGVGPVSEYVGVLRGRGVPPETPVAMVEPDGKTTITGTLETVVGEARDAGIAPPVVTVVGDVVSVREDVVEYVADGSGPAATSTGPQRDYGIPDSGTR